MINYFEGTVFNAPVKTIVNTVNCVGVMGAGVALEFKLRYPEMYEDYKDKCKNKELKVGYPRIYEQSNICWIMNFPTKAHWRYPSKIEWIEKGLQYFVHNYKKRDIESIAFPKLGTNNGGLDWDLVKRVMESYLNDIDLPVYICLDEKKESDGIERKMVDLLNTDNLSKLLNNTKISKKQLEVLFNSLPINRFWNISKFDGVTLKTYESIFRYYYCLATTEKERKSNIQFSSDIISEQLSLF